MTQLIILPLAVQHAARVPRPHRTQNDAADDELLFDGWPTSVSFPQLLEKLVPAAARNRFAINIGAADGKNHDPTYPLFRDLGYAGVAIEGSARVMGTLHANLAAVNSSGRLRVVHGFADPATIASVVTSAGAPKDADVLKIDIDSIDMPVLHALLSGAGMRPKLISMEINCDIPPPVQWHAGLLSSGAGGGGGFAFSLSTAMGGFYGASLDALHSYLLEAGWGLVAIELGSPHFGRKEHNAWFARADLMEQARVPPPTRAQMVRAFWRHHWLQHYGLRERPARPFPFCIHRSPCPLAEIRAVAEAVCGAPMSNTSWRGWAEASSLLAADAAGGAAFATRVALQMQRGTCKGAPLDSPSAACPFGVGAAFHLGARKMGGAECVKPQQLPPARQYDRPAGFFSWLWGQ